MRLTLIDLVHKLQSTTNPVTIWSLKECIKERLYRNDFS